MRWWLGLLILAGLMSPLSARAEYDRKLFCREGANEVLVLIDITSGLDERARNLLSDGVQKIIEQLEPGERLRVSTITDQVTTSEVLFTECKPFCPNDVFDLFSNCTEGLLRLENRRFSTTVKDSLRERLLRATSLDFSDIVRTLNASVRSRHADIHLDLFVFSDLIENSEFMSGKEFWSARTSTLMSKLTDSLLVPDLSNATIHAFGVGRGGSGERKALPQARMKSLTAFWTSYFELAGTSDVTLSEFLVP